MSNDQDSTITNLPGELISANDDDFLVIDDSTDSDPLTKTKKIKKNNLVKITIKNYDATTSYAVGDVVRLLDAENFVCVTETSGTSGVPEPFDPEKWTPSRSDIETKIIKTGLQNAINIVSIQGDGSGLYTIELGNSDYVQAGDHITISQTGSYDESQVDVNIVLSGNVISATGTLSSTNIVNSGLVTNNNRFAILATKGFFVDGANPFQPLVTPVDMPITFGYEGNNNPGIVRIYLTPTGTVQLENPPFDDPTLDNRLLRLGFLLYEETGTDILGVQAAPNLPTTNTNDLRYELMTKQAKMPYGGLITKGATGTSINRSAGTYLYPSGSYAVDPTNPNGVQFGAFNPVPFFLMAELYANGPGENDFKAIQPTSSNFNTDQYNKDGLTLENIPVDGPQFQVLRIYSNTLRLFYYHSQDLYENIELAQSNLDSSIFSKKIATSLTSFRGFAIVKRGVTDWNVAVENVDYKIIPMPEGNYDYDGVPQNRTLGLSHLQVQAAIANQSSGVIDEGIISNYTIPISTISGNGAVVTVTTSIPHGETSGNFVSIDDNIDYNEEFVVITVSSPTVFSYNSTNTGVTVDGDVVMLNRINIQQGSGQITDHSIANDYGVLEVEWDAEEDVHLITPTNYLNNSLLYVYKILSGGLVVTSFVPADTANPSAVDIRDKILLGVIKTRKGLTSTEAAQTIWSIQNLRIALVNPRSQLDDFTQHVKYRVRDGNIISAVNPAVDFTVTRSGGNLVGRGLNFSNNSNSPNVLTTSEDPLIEFFLVDRNGFIDGSEEPVTLPNPNLYDNDGVLTAVANNQYTVQRKWCEPESNRYAQQYGTKVYPANDIQAGDVSYLNENPPPPEGMPSTAFVLSTDLVKGATTNYDVDENTIFQGDVTGGTVSGGSGGGGDPSTWAQYDADSDVDMAVKPLLRTLRIESALTPIADSLDFLRLGNNQGVAWRNNGNTENYTFKLQGANEFVMTNNNLGNAIFYNLITGLVKAGSTPLSLQGNSNISTLINLVLGNDISTFNTDVSFSDKIIKDTSLVQAGTTSLSLQGNSSSASPINLVLGNNISTFNTDVLFSNKYLKDITEIQLANSNFYISSITGDLQLATPDLSSIELIIGNLPYFIVDNTGVSVQNQGIRKIETLSFLNPDFYIAQLSSFILTYNAATASSHEFQVATTPIVSINATELNLLGHEIINVGKISFSQATHYIQQSGNSLSYEVPLNKFHEFNIVGNPALTVSDTLIDVHNIPIVDVQNIIYDVSTLGAPHDPQNIDFDEDDKQTFTLNQGFALTTTSNRATGKQKLLRVVATGSHTFNLNLIWNFFGDDIPNTNGDIGSTNGDIWEILFECWGTAEADVDVTIYKKQAPAPP